MTNNFNLAHIFFLRWLLFVVLMIFGVLSLNYFNFLSLIYTNDPTHISIIIMSVFALTTAYCGVRVFRVSNDINAVCQTKSKFEAVGALYTRPGSLVSQHTDDIKVSVNRSAIPDQSTLINYRASQYHDKHEIIWQVAEILVTLGLVGTVVGFIMALWPFFQLETFNFDNVKNSLGQISGGIAVALFTTLVGLVSNILLRIQAQMIETATNIMLSELAHTTEIYIIPILAKKKT